MSVSRRRKLRIACSHELAPAWISSLGMSYTKPWSVRFTCWFLGHDERTCDIHQVTDCKRCGDKIE